MRLGIDIGGTKIEAAVVDDDGIIVGRKRVPTADSYDQLIGAIARLVDELERQLGRTRSVGVGSPGVAAASGVIRNAQNTPLEGSPFGVDLERALRRPIRIANDAHCFAMSEALDGAGTGAGTVLGMIIGTGCAGGLVVGGRLVTGPTGVGGEWGHNPLPWPRMWEMPGPPCTCGRRGCIESWLSGPALRRDHQAVTGEDLAPAEIARRAGEGEAGCRATLDRYMDRLARALASVIHIVDPDVIVLGGGVSAVRELYEVVPRLWGEYVLGGVVNTKLLPSRHGDSSGVRGAAWLWS